MTPTPTRRHILSLLVRERSDPDPYYLALAQRTVDELPVELDGASVIDLGCGSGHDAEAMRLRGASVVSIDIDADTARRAFTRGTPSIAASALATPFADDSFDGVYCSNVLEHVPSPEAFFDEVGRVLRPGGWAWVSWTNWYSPWGGHNITPLHYLGPERGLAAWSRLFGAPDKNVPGEGLFVTTIGGILDLVEPRRTRHHPRDADPVTTIGGILDLVEGSDDLALVDAWPRYYPGQRWILSVPGVREVLTWNCAMLLRRR